MAADRAVERGVDAVTSDPGGRRLRWRRRRSLLP